MKDAAQEASRELLFAGAIELGLTLDDAHASALLRYLGLLEQWNRAFNLVGPGTVTDWVARHLLDSLAILRSVALSGRLLDVGSGAGLPGVPLAVALPNLEVTLLEPSRKRQSFLHRVLAELSLSNARVEGTRLETLPGTFDAVVARAVWAPEELATAVVDHLAPDGTLIVLSGSAPPDELPGGLRRASCDTFTLPRLALPRAVSSYRRTA